MEKFICLGVMFARNSRQKEELNIPNGKASTVMRELQRSLVMKRELPKQAVLLIFKAVSVHGRKSRLMTERMRFTIRAAKMEIFRKN